MNDLNSPSPTPDMVEDHELEELLTRAYEAPPMPHALLKRIDQVVEQEWGQSPGIGDTTADKLYLGVIRGTRWIRSLPIAAAVVLVVGLVIFSQLSAPTYAWTTMVDALEQAGLVEIESEGTVRWLSVSDEAAGEKVVSISGPGRWPEECSSATRRRGLVRRAGHTSVCGTQFAGARRAGVPDGQPPLSRSRWLSCKRGGSSKNSAASSIFRELRRLS